jgi:ABC-type amino acid transport substrate-binding protein
VVGTKEAPPFAMKGADGAWHGLSIDLWHEVAAELGLAFELREYNLVQLLDSTAAGSVDAAVAAVTITAEREEQLDFSHPFYSGGLSIAARRKASTPWLSVLGRLFSYAFIKVIAALAGLLLAVGVVAWLLERRRNPEQFGGGAVRGIANGFWWSAVTMTTVGYGDKAPVTFWGRLLAVAWMFAGIVTISMFTAAIAAALTVSGLDSPIRSPRDLPNVRVGTVPHSAAAAYLAEKSIPHAGYGNVEQGLQALASDSIDAFVYDTPILRHAIHTAARTSLTVLPFQLLRQDYGIAFPQGSTLREEVNRVLLRKVVGPQWRANVQRYLGE